jgi:hypothetical protein
VIETRIGLLASTEDHAREDRAHWATFEYLSAVNEHIGNNASIAIGVSINSEVEVCAIPRASGL